MDQDAKRKNSPRAPSMALEECLARAIKMYQAERRHPTRVEVAMGHIGYTGKSGAALQAMASLGYWGLVERPKDGYVAVAKDVEDYQFTPDSKLKQGLLKKFMRSPALFASMLDQYGPHLPSDQTITFELIQRGFSPPAAGACLNVFKKSLDFSNYFAGEVVEEGFSGFKDEVHDEPAATLGQHSQGDAVSGKEGHAVGGANSSPHGHRLPVKLSGGRTAWIEFPDPFYSADRVRLKGYIDLHLADDEEEM
jgi:hypothetical protein